MPPTTHIRSGPDIPAGTAPAPATNGTAISHFPPVSPSDLPGSHGAHLLSQDGGGSSSNTAPAAAVVNGGASSSHLPNGEAEAAPGPLTIHASRPWIVQKYGGTSVGKFLSTIAQSIVPQYLQGHNVAIVCSARSGQTKALGTTNLLLQAAKQALEGDAGPSDVSGIGSGSVVGTAEGTPGVVTPAAGGRAGAADLSGAAAAARGSSRSAFARGGALSSPSRSNSLSRTNSAGSFPSLLNGKLAALSVGSGSSSEIDPNASAAGTAAAGGATATQVQATGFNATVDRIFLDHVAAARQLVTKDKALLAQLEEDIEEDCERLRDFLLAAKIIEEISPRSNDIIMGIGERLSCRIVVGALRDSGVDAELVGLENIVDQAFLDSLGTTVDTAKQTFLDQAFYDKLSEKLGEQLRACKGVPVVTGYFGNVPGSLLQQIGRGYTDLCAALCAVGLQAQELQIWKEVDGVFTADPRKVPTARLIPAITPEEAAELTYYGSEVIHPFTMEQAIKKAVPIRIKNVENPAGMGTVIFPDREGEPGGDHAIDGMVEQPKTPGASSGASTPWGTGSGIFTPSMSAVEDLSAKPRKLPTAVTIKDDILVLNVHSNRKTISHGFFARIFSVLDRYGVVVDLISTSEVHVSMAMSGAFRRGQLERIREELQAVGTVSILRDMVIVSLVGKQMRNMVGVAGKMFTTLAEGNVNIEMISQGANEINISCVVHKRNALKAINLIHYSVLEVSPKPANTVAGNFGSSFF